MDGEGTTYQNEGRKEQVPKPTAANLREITELLKVKTSMLALGACDRVKKISREYPKDIATSTVLTELINNVRDDPLTPLAGACMSALSSLAMHPDGRQMIFLQGGTTPLITLAKEGDVSHINTDKAVALLMNLAADSVSRKQMREDGIVEALVNIIRLAPMESIMEHALGTLHNVMLTDSRAKRRAVDANIAEAIARILSSRLQPEGCLINVRVNMIISDLLQIQDLQDKVNDAAKAKGWRIPPVTSFKKMQPTKLAEPQSVNVEGSGNGSRKQPVTAPSKKVVNKKTGIPDLAALAIREKSEDVDLDDELVLEDE